MNTIPLYGQKPTIPAWVAGLLQAERFWTFILLTPGLAWAWTEPLENEAVVVRSVAAIITGVVGFFLANAAARFLLKVASRFVYTRIGPPPARYRNAQNAPRL